MTYVSLIQPRHQPPLCHPPAAHPGQPQPRQRSRCVIIIIITILTCLIVIVQEVKNARPRLSAGWVVVNWRRMLSVPGTAGMVALEVTYKLCERGEATLPIYLVDKGVPVSSLAFWKGVVRSVNNG